MQAVDRFVASMTHASRFLQQVALDGRDITDLQSSQVSSFKAQIATFSLDYQSGSLLTESINSGPWSSEQKRELIDAVSARVSMYAQPTTNKSQSCKFFERYLAEGDWNVLESDQPLGYKVAQLCSRAAEIKLRYPDEQAIGRMVAVLIVVDRKHAALSYDAAHRMYTDFKTTLKHYLKDKTVTSLIMDYPMNPAASTLHFEHDKQPSAKWEQYPAITTVFNDLVLRSNSKKLQLKDHSMAIRDVVTNTNGTAIQFVHHANVRSPPHAAILDSSQLQVFKPKPQQLAIIDSPQPATQWDAWSGARTWNSSGWKWPSCESREASSVTTHAVLGSAWDDVCASEHAALGDAGESSAPAPKPKTSRAGAVVAAPILKRPAAAPVLKRPAAAAPKWPPAPLGTKAKPAPTTIYNGCKLQVSFSKLGYRGVLPASNRIDKIVRWGGDQK